MGKVEKLLRGRDDVVRAAEVVTVDNSLRQVRLKRPIQKLYPLEVNARDEDPATVVGASVHRGSRNIQVVRGYSSSDYCYLICLSRDFGVFEH